MSKARKLVKVIDLTGREIKRPSLFESNHKVVVSKGVYDEIVTLQEHCTRNNRNDSVDTGAMVELAGKLGLGLLSYWIKDNGDSYLDAVFSGFTTDSTNLDREGLRTLRRGVEHKGSIEFVVDLLLEDKYSTKEEIAFELKKHGFCKDMLKDKMPGYVTRLVRKVEKLGYIVNNLSNKRYVIKGASEELLNLMKETKERGEVMSKKSSKKPVAKEVAKEVVKETPKKEVAKKEVVKKAAKKEVVKKESIRDFVIKVLKQKATTKRELAEQIIKSGLTTSTEIDPVIKYLNVMFYKFRKNNVGLKCKLSGDKNHIGYFSM